MHGSSPQVTSRSGQLLVVIVGNAVLLCIGYVIGWPQVLIDSVSMHCHRHLHNCPDYWLPDDGDGAWWHIYNRCSTVNFSVLASAEVAWFWKDPFLEDIVSTQINWLSGWNWSVLGKSDFNNKICLRNLFEKSKLGTPSSAPNREVAWIEI